MFEGHAVRNLVCLHDFCWVPNGRLATLPQQDSVDVILVAA